ncbi:MAG: mechanosensitive ion channel, partial [Pedobacter sp.]
MNNEFFSQVIWGNTIRQYAIVVAIILIGLLFKRIVSRILGQLIFRLFKKFADQVNSETFIALLLKPIEFFISIFSLYVAIKQLSHPLNATFFNYKKTVGTAKVAEAFTFGELIDKIFLFLILLSIFWIVLRIIDFIAHVLLVRAAQTKNRADDQLVPFIKELLKFIISFIGFFVLLGYVFEVNAVSLITGLGIGGIAIAMAAKESLENLLGSFLIFLDKPFTVGDVVRVDGVEGTI